MKILTHKTTLVPAELFRSEEANRYLELCGLRCAPSEQVVWSIPVGGVVAVMAIDRLTVDSLPATEGFISPLLEGPDGVTEPTVWLARYGELLYIKVYDPALRLAEVVRAECNDDLLYYVATLGEIIPTRRYRLRLDGEQSAALKRLLKPFFK